MRTQIRAKICLRSFLSFFANKSNIEPLKTGNSPPVSASNHIGGVEPALLQRSFNPDPSPPIIINPEKQDEV
jgi:hypothetical protein